VIRIRITDGESSRQLELDGNRLVIGRSPDCDVEIESNEVSREHAELSRGRAGWVVADLESRNGTFVNSERIERCAVIAGDVVRLGETVHVELLSLGSPATRASSSSSPNREGILRTLVLPGLVLLAALVAVLVSLLTHLVWLGIVLGLAVAGAALWWMQPRQLALLVVQGGDGDGQWFEIFEVPVRVGAGRDCDVLVPGRTVSGSHCVLDRDEEGIVVIDQGSSHGTFVNGERVTNRRLEEDDVLRLGEDVELVFEARL
jgi:pSer/pThr/pTyr-binding forkhead associated (FHA) protein